MWYNLTPVSYAKGLEFNAQRSEESGQYLLTEAEKQPWRKADSDHMFRQARRLRAMAKLCHRSRAQRAGDIDFLGLNEPSLPRETEDAVITAVEMLP